jgi:hypothetical protein
MALTTALLGGVHCARDCTAGVTDVHRQRIRSYSNFIRFIRGIGGLVARGDYITTLRGLVDTIHDPTVHRLAADLLALLEDDALARIKAGLPTLARVPLDLALKAFDDPGALLRGKIVDLVKRTSFYGELDAHAAALESLPDRLDPPPDKPRDPREIAASARAGADALRWFHAGLTGLRDLGTTRLPPLDIDVFEAVAYCSGQPASAVTGTVDAALRDVQDVIDALAAAADLCSA